MRAIGYTARMAFHKIKFSAVIEADPGAARELLLSAFREAKANRAGAARIMEVSAITFSRWVDKLDLRKEIDAIEARAHREGWHHQRHLLSPGRPIVHGRRSKKQSKRAA